MLRTPVGERFQSTPNDRHVDTRSLLRWEYVVTRHLGRLGFPVATPRELVLGEPDVLVSDFVMDDGRGADQVALGCVAATPAPLGTAAGGASRDACRAEFGCTTRFARLLARRRR